MLYTTRVVFIVRNVNTQFTYYYVNISFHSKFIFISLYRRTVLLILYLLFNFYIVVYMLLFMIFKCDLHDMCVIQYLQHLCKYFLPLEK